MKNIFLCSFMFKVKNTFKDYISQFEVKEILFIPTASHTEAYRDYVYMAWSHFESLGFRVRGLEVSELSSTEAKEAIEKAKILYVAGGNTFYLLQELQKKDLLDVIRKKVDEGMVYVGESAGGVIACPDIDFVNILDPKEEAPELRDTKGLGLVDFYMLPHYLDRPYEDATAKTFEKYKDELDFTLLDNSEAVIGTANGEFEILGEDKRS